VEPVVSDDTENLLMPSGVDVAPLWRHTGDVELSQYVARLQHELLAVADAGGSEARAVAERLVAPLDSAVRLAIIEVLTEAFDTITTEIAPGSVHLRLRGRDPDVVVTPPPVDRAGSDPAGAQPAPAVDDDDGPVARINFRPPESLKARIEEAAAHERLSVNAWLVRATSAAVDGRAAAGPARAVRHRFSGWVG
jgi:hypothetical protein